MFSILLYILCMPWLPDVCDLSTSSESGYYIFRLSYKHDYNFAFQWISLGMGRDSAVNYYITCHLADAFIQSDLQLIRLSSRHTPWSNVGLRALLKGQQLCRSYHGRTWDQTTDLCGSKSSSLTTAPLCWYSMEHICWLMSSRVQGIKWASDHCAAARYAVGMKIIVSPEYFFHCVQQENLSEETIIFISTSYLAAAWWFEAHLTSWTLDDLKPCI